jgi:hypothetical protein
MKRLSFAKTNTAVVLVALGAAFLLIVISSLALGRKDRGRREQKTDLGRIVQASKVKLNQSVLKAVANRANETIERVVPRQDNKNRQGRSDNNKGQGNDAKSSEGSGTTESQPGDLPDTPLTADNIKVIAKFSPFDVSANHNSEDDQAFQEVNVAFESVSGKFPRTATYKTLIDYLKDGFVHSGPALEGEALAKLRIEVKKEWAGTLYYMAVLVFRRNASQAYNPEWWPMEWTEHRVKTEEKNKFLGDELLKLKITNPNAEEVAAFREAVGIPLYNAKIMKKEYYMLVSDVFAIGREPQETYPKDNSNDFGDYEYEVRSGTSNS